MKNFRKDRGFTILELIISVAVLSFGIIGIYNAFSPLIELNSNTTIRFKATYLGQEGFEIIRNIRDTDFIKNITWSSLIDTCIDGCQADYKTGTAVEGVDNQLKAYDANNFLKINSDGLYGYDVGTDTIFKRKIIITQPVGTDVLKIDVLVYWSHNGKSYEYETSGYLYNWK